MAAAEPTHEAPEVFYNSVRTYRNFQTVLMLPLALLLAAPFLYGIYQRSPHGPPVFVLYAGAFVFVTVFLTGLHKIIENVQEISEINSAGIMYRDKQWGWPEILSIQAARQSFSKCVRLQIKTEKMGIRTLIGKQPLTPAEYEILADRLTRYLALRYPHVQIQRSAK